MAQLQHRGTVRRGLNVGSHQHQASNPFGMKSLTDPTSQLPWNHIVAKNTGGGVSVHIPQHFHGLAEWPACRPPGRDSDNDKSSADYAIVERFKTCHASIRCGASEFAVSTIR
jgi:hypothetical protein